MNCPCSWLRPKAISPFAVNPTPFPTQWEQFPPFSSTSSDIDINSILYILYSTYISYTYVFIEVYLHLHLSLFTESFPTAYKHAIIYWFLLQPLSSSHIFWPLLFALLSFTTKLFKRILYTCIPNLSPILPHPIRTRTHNTKLLF